MSVFDTKAHIKKIADHLFSARPTSGRKIIGRAALMIGAGFSQNAIRKDGTSAKMPNWNQLTQEMLMELYPANSLPMKAPLRAAGEYSAQFSQNELTLFIEKAVANDAYEPHSLHLSFLELEWSDVFTTNYDTLLEEAAKRLTTRNYYSIVTQISDLPLKNQPRIVKLHGTIGMHRPYIITEEHYRTYERRYAPFVNLARQSLMENLFCLVGFSADDPNFQQWYGWIRDQLSSSANQVYLLDVGNMHESESKFLAAQGITVLSLNQLVPTGSSPEEQLDAFVKEIHSNKPLKWTEWAEQ